LIGLFAITHRAAGDDFKRLNAAPKFVLSAPAVRQTQIALAVAFASECQIELHGLQHAVFQDWGELIVDARRRRGSNT
jgi:hypothetical protein